MYSISFIDFSFLSKFLALLTLLVIRLILELYFFDNPLINGI